MNTEIYSRVAALFKDAARQLETLSSSGSIEKLKADLHAYSTEIAMFFVKANKEGMAIAQEKYEEILRNVEGIVNKAKMA